MAVNPGVRRVTPKASLTQVEAEKVNLYHSRMYATINVAACNGVGCKPRPLVVLALPCMLLLNVARFSLMGFYPLLLTGRHPHLRPLGRNVW